MSSKGDSRVVMISPINSPRLCTQAFGRPRLPLQIGPAVDISSESMLVLSRGIDHVCDAPQASLILHEHEPTIPDAYDSFV